MAYPEKITDLKPDQFASGPVVLIDYDRALKDPSQFTPFALSEINGWAVRENKTPIASDSGCLR